MKKVLVLFFMAQIFNGFSQTLKIVDTYGKEVSGAVVELKSTDEFYFANEKGELVLTSEFEGQSIQVFHADFENANYDWDELEESNFIVYLYDCEFTLDEIIVTGSRLPERKSLASPQIKVIHSKDIVLGNAPTTADILSNSGEVFVQKSQLGGGSPNLRGFEANKILLMIDGVRLNNAIFRSGHLQNIINTNANAVRQIEILYGAGSVMYGSDALGGVIHISTKSPSIVTDSAQISGKVLGRITTADKEKTIQANLEYKRKKWATSAYFNYSDFDDLRQGAKRNNKIGDLGLRPYYAVNTGTEDVMIANNNPNVQRFTGYKQYNFNQKTIFKPNDNTTHLLNFQWSTTSDVPRYDRLSEIESDGNQKYAQWYYGPQHWLFASYNFQKFINSKWADQFNFIITYQNFKESRHKRNFNDPWLKNQIEKVDVASVSLDFQKKIKITTLKYGIDAYFNKVDSKADEKNIYFKEILNYQTRYPDGGSDMNSFAAYLNLQTELAEEKLYLSEGFRYTFTYLQSRFINQTFFPFPYNKIEQKTSNGSGFIGLVYKPKKDIRIAVNANTGFRTPNVDDMGKVFDSSPGYLIVPNPKIKPEKTIGFDFLLSAIFWQKLKLETAAYYTQFRDIITLQPGIYNGESEILYEDVLSEILQASNAGKANIYGWNISAEALLTKNIKLSANYTYAHGIVLDEENYPLDHIPPAFGKIDLEYKYKKFLLSIYSIFNAKKDIKDYSPFGEDNEKYATPNGMPAWVTYNAKANYNIGSNSIIGIGLENILDTNYRVFASGISAPGRNFIISFNYAF